ncbi:hypothetical protein J2X31_001072 [Flavobacterium arsenatis]|uniref:Alpha/beta hydrolase n=1 Tax=Flavobacterium arsenatis TaxID=1484332 RepID=A0ABU1TNT3_9FLAO|nr:hypothetical protein [Flavobacterium arsenatis]MDR6967072.1 hypothetical protein [Flavobacterium arsenatis]
MSAKLSKLNYINVGKKGTFQYDSQATLLHTSSPKEIDELFDELKRKQVKKIAMYFHGGLVPSDEGIITAERIIKYVNRDTDAYPICFVWDTGIKRTVLDNLDTIWNSAFFRRLLVRIIKIAGGELGIESITEVGSRGVSSLSDTEIYAELEKPVPFERYRTDTDAKSATIIEIPSETPEPVIDRRLRKSLKGKMEEEIEADKTLRELANEEKPDQEAELFDNKQQTEDEDSKGIVSSVKLLAAALKITVNIIKRHITQRNHGFYPTVVEEILREFYVADLGRWAWEGMKNKAAAMWNDDDFSGDSSKWHVGTYFIKKLDEYLETNELTVDLVGHSAGSIAICELIDFLKESNYAVTFRNIIFMAPACRCDLFSKTLLAYPKLYSSFRCFTMSDEKEKLDHLVRLYPRSLLYLISGILEPEQDAYILGLQRHVSGNYPYSGNFLDQVALYLKTENRIVYSITLDDVADGLRSGSVTHGGFDDDDETTLDSIMYLIKK